MTDESSTGRPAGAPRAGGPDGGGPGAGGPRGGGPAPLVPAAAPVDPAGAEVYVPVAVPLPAAPPEWPPPARAEAPPPRRRRRIWLIVAGAAVAVVAGAVATFVFWPQSPGTVVDGYLTAMVAGDAPTVRERTCEDQRANVQATIDQLGRDEADGGYRLNWQVLGQRVTGATAQVDVTLYYKQWQDGRQVDRSDPATYEMVREENAWRVCGIRINR